MPASVAPFAARPRVAPVNTDLSAIVDEHQSQVWWYLRLLGADRHVADDLTQETFLAVLRAAPTIRGGPGATLQYLRKAARGIYIRWCERDRRKPAVVEDLDLADDTWDRLHGDLPGDDERMLAALRACVNELAERDGRGADAIRGHYDAGHTARELAEQLETDEGHVRVILHRARAILKTCLERKLGKNPLQ